MHITDQLAGTCEQPVIAGLEEVYKAIDKRQGCWKTASRITCPDGCGKCCVNFEPDVLESEALYLAAWLIENQNSKAVEIMNGTYHSPRSDPENGCFLFDPDSPYHCTVYEGRCLICRLFGYSGDNGKDGSRRWKPCKFIPVNILTAHTPLLEHRQYEEKELKELFNSLPPSMAECVEQAVSLTPDNAHTIPLRTALPAAIKKLKYIMYFTSSGNTSSNNDEPRSA